MEKSRFKKWMGCILVLPLALTLSSTAYGAQGGSGGGTGSGNGNTGTTGGVGGTFGFNSNGTFDRVPLLVYTVASQNGGVSGTGSGGTGTGSSLADFSLVVYSDGLVTLGGAGLSASQEVAITTQQAFDFMRALRQVGGLRHPTLSPRIPSSPTRRSPR